MLTDIIETDIQNLIGVLVKTIPALQQVRVFGSYGTPKWDEKRSDVDLVVVINNEYYSMDKDIQHHNDCLCSESRQRKDLRLRISNQFQNNYRIKLHMITPKDILVLSKTNEGRGYIGIEMMKGRLLYNSSNNMVS
jgi:predicted nucleotidyltransferase